MSQVSLPACLLFLFFAKGSQEDPLPCRVSALGQENHYPLPKHIPPNSPAKPILCYRQSSRFPHLPRWFPCEPDLPHQTALSHIWPCCTSCLTSFSFLTHIDHLVINRDNLVSWPENIISVLCERRIFDAFLPFFYDVRFVF